MRKHSTALLGIFVLSLGLMSISTVLAEDSDGRIGQNLGAEESPTAEELATAILTPSIAPFLVSATKTGMAGQFEVYTIPLQGFPTDGLSWALISTGKANDIAGTATTFYSYATYGSIAPGWSNRGHWSYDIATLNLTLIVPSGATTLSFDWKFGTEENPTFTWSYRDTAKVIVTTSAGSTNILLLPNGNPVDVGTASLFSNPAGCSSASPCPPYPIPNETIYNAVTGWSPPNPNQIYTTTFDVTPFVGQNITISFQIGDENDRILDSALFIDNLNIEFPALEKMVKPVEGWLIQRFDFDEDTGYKNHQGIDIDSGIDGQDVVAAADGTVVYVQREIISGAGIWVWIWHGEIIDRNDNKVEKISTRYLHLKNIPQEIQPGAKVYKGKTVIGEVSNTGDGYFKWRFDPHLHFEVWQGGNPEIIKLAIAQGKAVGVITKLWNPNTEAGKLLEAQDPLRFVKYEDRSKKPNSLTFLVLSPVDLIVTDPESLIVSKDVNELPEMAWYFEMPIDEEGNPGYEFIAIDERKMGGYSIEVIPEPEASPIDTYSLEALGEGATIVLADNVPISDIPRTPYIIRSTETEIISIIPAFVDFDPDTLNLKSQGEWVTLYIELPIGYNINKIDLESLKLNGQIPAELKPTEAGDYDGNGVPDLMVKFNRAAVQDILEVEEKVKITISGNLIDERLLEGSDIIRVLNEGKGEK